MSILKNKLSRKFSSIPNEIITDIQVTETSLRVYLYLVSKPDGWQVSNSDIQNKLNIKTSNRMAAAWKNLLETGWVTREKIVGSKGKFTGGFDYVLNESSIKAEKESTSLRVTHNMDDPYLGMTHNMDNPSLGETPHQGSSVDIINTDINNSNTELNNKKKNKSSSPDVDELINYFNQKTGRNCRKAKEVASNIEKVLKQYSIEDCKLVIDFITTDTWHVQNKQDTLSNIFKPTKFYERLERAQIFQPSNSENNPYENGERLEQKF